MPWDSDVYCSAWLRRAGSMMSRVRVQYQADTHHKIVKFIGNVAWHDTITIKTTYPSGSRPEQLSGYGRGTTLDDIRNGDSTLGFHESCHRRDYVALAQGETAEAILADYPSLEPEDIRACLAYAHAVLADDSLDAVQVAK